MNGKAGTLIVALAIVTAGGLLAWANQPQTPAATGSSCACIGVVDLVKVFNDFQQTKALNAELDRYRLRLGKEQQEREEKLSVERDTLKGFAPDSAEYQKRSRALKKLIVDYQAWLAGERESLKDEHCRWIERTYGDINKAVAAVAKSKGLQLVLTREELETDVEDGDVIRKQILNRKVLYYDASMDISEAVLVALNDAFAKAGGANAVKLGGSTP